MHPATAHRSPLVSRSDAKAFHIFLEESYVRPNSSRTGLEVVALFRYDVDSAGVKGESTLALLPVAAEASAGVVPELEKAARPSQSSCFRQEPASTVRLLIRKQWPVEEPQAHRGAGAQAAVSAFPKPLPTGSFERPSAACHFLAAFRPLFRRVGCWPTYNTF